MLVCPGSLCFLQYKGAGSWSTLIDPPSSGRHASARGGGGVSASRDVASQAGWMKLRQEGPARQGGRGCIGTAGARQQRAKDAMSVWRGLCSGTREIREAMWRGGEGAPAHMVARRKAGSPEAHYCVAPFALLAFFHGVARVLRRRTPLAQPIHNVARALNFVLVPCC